MRAIAVSFAARRPISGRRRHGWQHADTATAEAHGASLLLEGAGGARSRRQRRRRGLSSSSTDYYPGLHEDGRRLRLRIASPAQVIVEARLAGSAVATASNAAFNMAANDFLRPPPGPRRRPLSWARPPAHQQKTSATLAPDDASLAGVGFSGRLLSGRRCASRGSHIERHSSFFPGPLRLRAEAVPLSPRRSQRAVSACVKGFFSRLLCSWFLFT